MLTKSVAAQAPFAATTHTITFYFKSGSRNQGPETRDRERAPARCCLQSLSAFEHHGVELRQHAHTTCAQPGWLSTGQRSLQQRPCCCAHRPEPTEVTPSRALMCCALRVSRAHASPVPCPLPCSLAGWLDCLPFSCGERPCGGDGVPPGPRRRPERQRPGTRTTRSLLAGERRERGSKGAALHEGLS